MTALQIACVRYSGHVIRGFRSAAIMIGLEISETNETGDVVATYVSSTTDDGKGRVDVMVSAFDREISAG